MNEELLLGDAPLNNNNKKKNNNNNNNQSINQTNKLGLSGSNDEDNKKQWLRKKKKKASLELWGVKTEKRDTNSKHTSAFVLQSYALLSLSC